MTPTEIETAARERYNSIGDTFWSQAEIFTLIWAAQLDAHNRTNIIERTYSATTVQGTQEYPFPTGVTAIKRVTYNDQKLKPISEREDDAVTGLNQSTLSQGTPQYYTQWNETLALRPIPDSAMTLKIRAYTQPSAVAVASTLELPSQFHMEIVNYCVGMMAAKDLNYNAAQFWLRMWGGQDGDGGAIATMRKYVRKMKRADGFASVQDEDSLIGSWLGAV